MLGGTAIARAFFTRCDVRCSEHRSETAKPSGVYSIHRTVMSSKTDSRTATMVADRIERLKAEILLRWQDQVRRNPEQAALTHKLDDQELKDHLPALTGKIIEFLRGKAAETFEEDAARHGRQRRELGYSVVPLLRELQIFRRVLIDMVLETAGADVSAEEIERGRNLIIDAVDRSMNISILQYTLAAEEERDSARGEARELNQQRDRFLATLSHELRNQISPILLSAQLLKDLKPGDQRIEQAVQRIERQARHQAILIDDLLDISRYRYGKLQLTRKNLDLRVPVERAVETFQNDIRAREFKMEVELPERPIYASADETRLTQVIINLLSNALKFTPPGGTISIRLSEQAGGSVLAVRDTGIGIEPALLPSVFTMFFQADEPSKEVRTGLGVGLALAKVLVQMHDGTIEAHSEGVGKGAEFVVRLPLLAHMPEQMFAPPARTVLVVDDNPDHLGSLADLLRMRGYEVIEARDASEALRLISEHTPQACVIDIGLPDMDGYELARKLRQLPEARDSKLVAVTGYGTKADRQAFEEAGFDHYFPKPPNLEELNRVLSER
jgi:signal transduction histidine kinase/CheY-like chemotaxis protein